MKVSIINTLHYGGAGRAALRLLKGLRMIDEDADLLVKQKSYKDRWVHEVNILDNEYYFEHDVLYDIQKTYINENRTNLSDTYFSFPYPGINLSNTKKIQESDIINIHWVAQFLSPETIAQLINTGKPVVWTMHDMNPFTGGCHYSAGCEEYKNDCFKCPQLKDDPFQLPNNILKIKQLVFGNNITVVTPSRWLADCAKKSKVFNGSEIHCIPNSVETDLFKPYDKKWAKNKFGLPEDSITLLFGAEHHKEKRKGFSELMDSMRYCLADQYFSHLVNQGKVNILTLGNPVEEIKELNIHVKSLGYIQEDELLAQAYSCADIYLLPSKEDNLPNNMLESMSCGTPVIAYKIGGTPDTISNGVDGFLVEPFDTNKFGDHIIKLIQDHALREKMSNACRNKIVKEYNLQTQANSYLQLFKKLLRENGKTEKNKQVTDKKHNSTVMQEWDTDINYGLFPIYRHYMKRLIERIFQDTRNTKQYSTVDRVFDRIELLAKKTFNYFKRYRY